MSDRWRQRQINLGDTNVGEKRKFSFMSTGELPEIETITASCGCTTPEYNKEEGVLIVNFKAGKIPKHLQGKQNYYNTSKYITVFYKNGLKDVLSFTSKIIQQ